MNGAKRPAAAPAIVAMRGLTPVQRKLVLETMAGSMSYSEIDRLGGAGMTTASLVRKGIWIETNAGTLRLWKLTPLGLEIGALLRARPAEAK